MENNDTDKKLEILIVHAIGTNQRLDAIDENLEEHMKRSAASEARLDYIENEVKPLLDSFKGLKFAISALTFVTAIVKILDFFKH